MPGNKPEMICGKPHKCWNNPDRKVASSAEIINDGRMLVTASSAETNSICKLREIIRFTVAVVVTEVETLVEEIIAVMVEVLSISLNMHQGGGGETISSTFVK